jgi:hypothetical protein
VARTGFKDYKTRPIPTDDADGSERVVLVCGPEGSPNFCFGLYRVDEPHGCLEFVQSDWDYPGLASRLGWGPGTEPEDVDAHLAEAYDWLVAHDGEEFELEVTTDGEQDGRA